MATLDALEPQSRAIVELLLRQQQGYEELASTLDMPTSRVRERAREALVALAPASARRVDEEWRGQIADYVLGQQTGPEAKATRGHLKRSEPARAWVASLIDSLDPLYGDAERPEIPKPGADRDAERPRRRGGARRGRAAAGGAAAGAAGAAPAASAAGAVTGARPDDTETEETAAGAPEAATAEAPETAPEEAAEPSGDETAAAPAARLDEDRASLVGTEPAATEEELAEEEPLPPPVEPAAEAARPGGRSPEARAIIRRRRLVAAGVGAAVLVAVIVLAIVLIGGGDEDRRAAPEGPGGRAQTGAGGQAPQARLVGQAEMRPVGDAGRDVRGVAVIAERGGQNQLLVQARGLEPTGRGAAYEVWLYNSPSDAVSLGGQVTDDRGNLQGAGPLPQNFRQYRFIDISRERIDRNAKHSGSSVLRVPLAEVLRGGQAARAGGGAGGGR